jgi:ATP-dependent DNA helicase DinG
VVGDALSVVVIDKLPFAAPDDPVFEARLEAIRRDGGNPFRDEQLPQAVIALKQGVGRLIRSETDRGVLVLCDPRLTGKPYGKTFLDSLPPFARTREVADVERFFGIEPSPAAPAPDIEQDWYEAARF